MRLLSTVRFDEVCLLQGAPLIGALFSIGALTPQNVFVLAAVMVGSISLVAHVFVLNDWSGIHGDLRDPARANRTFVAKGVSRTELGCLATVLLVLSLLLFWLVGVTTFVVAAVIASASALYSAPRFT
jgi:4-hydroxybenzoate polyprenyltransferase